jgi:hypothetical protein
VRGRVAREKRTVHRFGQNRGAVHISALTVMSLEMWLLHVATPLRYQQGYMAVL